MYTNKKSQLSPFAFLTLLYFAISSIAHAEDITSLRGDFGGQATLSENANTGNISFVSLPAGEVATSPEGQPRSAEQAAIQFLQRFNTDFGITDAETEFVLVKQIEDSIERTRHVLKFQQVRDQIPVFGAQVTIRMNSAFSVSGANLNISSTPSSASFSVDKDESANTAIQATAKSHPTFNPSTFDATFTEQIFNAALLGEGANVERPVRIFEVTNPALTLRNVVIVDAENNSVLTEFDQIHDAKDRLTHDQEENPANPLPTVTPVRIEGQGPVGQIDVDQAHDFAGDTYDFLFNEHGRDSLDDNGFSLISAVRYCQSTLDCPLANAFWNGQWMTYGTGFATDDIVAHELVHGFTEFTSNLIYLNESGAINESLSDIWGEWVDLGNNAGNDSANVRWLLGEDVPVFGAIRNMQDPPALGDPDRIGAPEYFCGTSDNGGVHTNSGVNNKAAYLMSDGGTFNGFTVNQVGIPKTADIYYRAQTLYLNPSSGYLDLYNALNQSCSDLIGTGGITASDCSSVNNAMLAVEMSATVCPAPPPVTADYCPAGEVPTVLFGENFETSSYATNWVSNNIVGTNNWLVDSSNPVSGTSHLHGDNQSTTTDTAFEMDVDVSAIAGMLIAFDHFADIEPRWDGGVVEYSTDSGANWDDLLTDPSSPPVVGLEYDDPIIVTSNPLSGRDAFSGHIQYSRTIAGVPTSAVGGDFRIRFRIGTDGSVSRSGWDVDDVQMYTCAIPANTSLCAGAIVTVDIGAGQIPTSGNDVILGTGGDDVIYAGAGDDIVCGLGGNDFIYGGDGYDILYGQSGADHLYGEDSFDDLYGGSGDDTIFGGTDSGLDFSFGQGGNDFIDDQNGYGFVWGGSGSDEVKAGLDGAVIRGGGNNDILSGGTGADIIYGESGLDVIVGASGNDELYGGLGADAISGGPGDDLVSGQGHNDTLQGGGGDDTIIGGTGNDSLDGQSGTDSCNGQGGNDTETACETVSNIPVTGLASTQSVLAVNPSIMSKLERCASGLSVCLTAEEMEELEAVRN